MPLTVVTPAVANPVDLSELKVHLRLVVDNPEGYTAEDSVLNLLIQAVTGAYQENFKAQLITATLRWDFDGWKRELELARPPFQSVDSVKYMDEDGIEQTVAPDNYRGVNKGRNNPGCVLFHSDYDFPETDPEESYPVRVEYKAGYGEDHSKVDDQVRLWLMNTIGTYYMQRESKLVSYTGSISVEEMQKEMGQLLTGQPKARRFG